MGTVEIVIFTFSASLNFALVLEDIGGEGGSVKTSKVTSVFTFSASLNRALVLEEIGCGDDDDGDGTPAPAFDSKGGDTKSSSPCDFFRWRFGVPRPRLGDTRLLWNSFFCFCENEVFGFCGGVEVVVVVFEVFEGGAWVAGSGIGGVEVRGIGYRGCEGGGGFFGDRGFS